jgi:hypothetical protein
MSDLSESAVAEYNRWQKTMARRWMEWCDERPIRQQTLLEHLARGRRIPIIYCHYCGRRHI